MKIKKITKTRDTIPTYDVEAKKYHHYYLDNGCISHNTSIVVDSSASFLPVFNKFSYESMNKMNIPVAPKFIKNRFWNYNEAYTIPTEKIVKLTSKIQYYIDCSISMELIINPDITNIKNISNSIIDGFDNGLKAVYYSRTVQIQEDGSKSVDGKTISCASCAN